MTSEEARRRFASARVARLATAGADGHPHVVPITFALLSDDEIVTAVDHKPKRTRALRRLANIAANPHVAVLVDEYSDDWSRLWWARADGMARAVETVHAAALAALAARYPPYTEHPPDGPLIVIAVERWSGWSALERPA